MAPVSSSASAMGRCPPQTAGLESCRNSLVHQLVHRGDWREKHHFHIGMKIRQRRICTTIVDHQQDLKRHTILLTVLLYFTNREVVMAGPSQLL
jgi:hypothetical protein